MVGMPSGGGLVDNKIKETNNSLLIIRRDKGSLRTKLDARPRSMGIQGSHVRATASDHEGAKGETFQRILQRKGQRGR